MGEVAREGQIMVTVKYFHGTLKAIGSNSDLYHENDLFVPVVLKEISTDSNKAAGLEGSWLGGREFFIGKLLV